MYFLNKTTLGFDWYDEDPKDKNLISLSDEYHQELITARNTGGKVISVVKNKIVVKDFVIPESDYPEIERRWRDSELKRADVELLKAEDDDGVGTPKEWRAYRKALRAWPENKDFPKMKFRPKAPDIEIN